ncbi:hypothetical protein FG386_002983 [Cryptosporidium ryanae]|uniref:uncharacterized protein n=1 Tax=Cryptosporidium ryanae TaxID=515981 RepID=UPI003519E52C|nr:hypothetical protein FG386_002983 [Cryptosporidium ryanae]
MIGISSFHKFIVFLFLFNKNLNLIYSSKAPRSKTQNISKSVPNKVNFQNNVGHDEPFPASDINSLSFIQATSITPSNGPINSIIKLSIHGIGFSMVSKLYVHFDVTEGPYEVVSTTPISDTLLEVETPYKISTGEMGKSVLISVYSHSDVVFQSTNALIFRFYQIPKISLIFPDHIGMSGGTELTILGSGLFASENLKCLFQSKERSKVVDASYSMNVLDLKKLNKIDNDETLLSIILKYTKDQDIAEADIDGIMNNIKNGNPMPSIVCESPSWTVSEIVSLSISFNGIQYHFCTNKLVFEEESSLFGNVAHVVKERDSPSEVISDVSDSFNNSNKLINIGKITSENIFRNSNQKTVHSQTDTNINRYTDNYGNLYSLSNPINESLLQSDYGLFFEFVILFYSSFIFGTICKYIGLPLLLGYIVGGYVVGPSGFSYVSQLIQIISIAQIGVCLILFTLGLEFSFKRLFSIGRSVIYCAIVSVFIFILFCSAYSLWAGTPINEGIFIGSFISMSSTAMVVGELQLDSNENVLTIGILILQDLLLGIILALIPALQSNSKSMLSSNSIISNTSKTPKFMLLLVYFCRVLWNIVRPFIVLILFIIISYVVKIAVFPFILYFLLKTKNREIILIGIISLLLSISSLTEYLGLSMEMGSFIAGVILSSLLGDDEVNTFKHDFIQSIESLRWIFSMLFFSGIGLIIDATFIWDNYWTIGSVCLFISFIKLTINFLIFLICGSSVRVSAHTSLMLANLGEFGFVLASKGISLGIISRKVYLILVATTVMSLLSTPVFLRLYSKVIRKKLTNIPMYDFNSNYISYKTKTFSNIGSRFSNFSKSATYQQSYRRGSSIISNITNNLGLSRITNQNITSNSPNDYNIEIKGSHLNSRFNADNIFSKFSIGGLNTLSEFDLSINENELENLSESKDSVDSKMGFDTPSISLENIDEFTLAHVTNLGNSIIRK